MPNEETKEIIIKRVIANDKRVETFDVTISNYDEVTDGIEVTYVIDGKEETQLITWWTIVFNA
jgi:hypothetical protein